MGARDEPGASAFGAGRLTARAAGPESAVRAVRQVDEPAGSIEISSLAAADGEVSVMPRARWFVFGFLLIAAVIGGFMIARGPFDAHSAIAYDQFLADFQAGEVGHIVQWRDQLEIAEDGALRSVVVPPDRDLPADLGQARVKGNVGIAQSRLPDLWLAVITPWVPLLLGVSAILIWISAVIRNQERPRPVGS
jgi:hypothetical protein